MDGKPISIGAKRPRALGTGVDRQRRDPVEEESLHVIARDDGDDVGGQGLDALLDPREGGVHAQDQVAVLGGGPDQELGRMRAGEGADQHQPSSAAIAPVTCPGTRAGASPAWPRRGAGA